MSILVYKVSKALGDASIVDRVSLYVPKVSLVALLGPSGSGKSSLLRLIAGLDTPDSGSIWLNGRDITKVPTQYRKMGFVFQNYALFKHMTVYENICFGLRLRGLSVQQITSRVSYLLDSLRISDIVSQYPAELSGGQSQRVALARSLAIQPEFLLLDEPFGALDGELRRHLSRWLKRYLKDNKITAIMVTHDQKEAVSMADEILILRDGRLIQQGEPQILYDQPIDDFVGSFLGSLIQIPSLSSNSLMNKVSNKKTIEEGLEKLVANPIWTHTFANRSINKYQFFLRPHELHLQSQMEAETSPVIIENVIYKKNSIYLQLLATSFSWRLTMQIGYHAFRQLKIRSSLLYIKPRPRVFLKGYPLKIS